MAKENLAVVGIWKFLSLEYQDDDGTVIYPFGKDVAGLAMIDARRYFSLHLIDMKRPSFKVPDPRGGTAEEVKTAFEGYIGYYGTFDLDETKGVIIFHVKGAWLPNWIGGDQIRYYNIERKPHDHQYGARALWWQEESRKAYLGTCGLVLRIF